MVECGLVVKSAHSGGQQTEARRRALMTSRRSGSEARSLQQKYLVFLGIAYELFTVLMGFINVFFMYDMLYNINECINT